MGADMKVGIGWVEIQCVVRHRYCSAVQVGGEGRGGEGLWRGLIRLGEQNTEVWEAGLETFYIRKKQGIEASKHPPDQTRDSRIEAFDKERPEPDLRLLTYGIALCLRTQHACCVMR